ncbi:MAG: glycosyltransferase family 39 protein [Blastocatellia bacterium]
MSEYILWAVTHLGLWSLMLLSAAGLGHLFLRKYQFDSLAERFVFTLSLGLGLSALLIFLLGIAGLFYSAIFLALTTAGALLTVVVWFRSHKGRLFVGLSKWRDYDSPSGVLGAFLILVVLGYWGLLLLSTQYPPMHWDAISHHLVLCREYMAHHRMFAVMGIPFPALPALNHMLFTWGIALKDDILAQMISHTFLMLTAGGLYTWGKRERKPMLGFAAAALWLGSPLVLWLGQSGYVDVCQVCFVFLGVYAMRVFWESHEPRWWYLAAALLGCGAGVKLPGLFFVIVGSLLGLWVLAKPLLHWWFIAGEEETVVKGEERSAFTWKTLLAGWAIAFAVLIPWYAFIFYYSGNPIWPTFPQFSRGIWGSPDVVQGANSWLKNAGQPRTFENFVMLSINWILHPEIFQAEVGRSLFPLLIAWPVTWVIALWNRSVRWWALWALSFTVYWFLFPNLLRYWLPALPLACLAVCHSIDWIVGKLSRSTVLQTAVFLVLGLAAIVSAARIVHGEIKVKGLPPVNAEEREKFLSMLSGYRSVKYINKQATPDETVCVISASYVNYYLKPQVLDLFAILQSNKMPSFHWPEDEPWQRWIESNNVDWILVNHYDAPGYIKLPKGNLVLNPMWPDYELVYADRISWVFRRKPVPPEVW